LARIVTSHYRYKRPPKKRPKAAPIEGPAGLTISDKTRKRVAQTEATAVADPKRKPAEIDHPPPAKSTPVNDDRKPAAVLPSGGKHKQSVIVTARRPGKRYADVPEVSEEEHRRVGDLADAMMREFKRAIAEKVRS
jgi:hypothetical protein